MRALAEGLRFIGGPQFAAPSECLDGEVLLQVGVCLPDLLQLAVRLGIPSRMVVHDLVVFKSHPDATGNVDSELHWREGTPGLAGVLALLACGRRHFTLVLMFD